MARAVSEWAVWRPLCGGLLEGIKCEEVEMKSLDNFFSKLGWGRTVGRERKKGWGDFRLEERYLSKT